jgi:hypothetical protein
MYGDYRTCFRCKKSADIVEKGKDYCADCYFICIIGKPIEEYERELLERENDKS